MSGTSNDNKFPTIAQSVYETQQTVLQQQATTLIAKGSASLQRITNLLHVEQLYVDADTRIAELTQAVKQLEAALLDDNLRISLLRAYVQRSSLAK